MHDPTLLAAFALLFLGVIAQRVVMQRAMRRLDDGARLKLVERSLNRSHWRWLWVLGFAGVGFTWPLAAVPLFCVYVLVSGGLAARDLRRDGFDADFVRSMWLGVGALTGGFGAFGLVLLLR